MQMHACINQPRIERDNRVKIFLALSLALLAGCGSGGGGSTSEPVIGNHGYGFEYDAQGAAGMRLRYQPVLTKADPLSDPVFFENIYAQVETCVGVTAPDPFVMFVPRGALGSTDAGLTIYGEYLTAPSLILLYGDLDKELEIARHEFVHYLLDVSTGNADAAHASVFFKLRADGGCT